MTKKHYSWKQGEALPELGPHSLAKHRILKRYLTRYIEILTATSPQEQLNITLVDGFAGGGKYSHGRDVLPGSPLILLETIAEMQDKLNASRPKGFQINADFIFIEQNPHHSDFLRSVISGSSFSSELDQSIQIWTADFNERTDEIIRRVRARSPRAGRAIFLLDQYGWSQVALRSIRAVLNQLANAEIFLTFSVDALIDYLSDRSLDMRAFGNIDMDRGQVQELINYKSEDQIGSRALIQNTLYSHIQSETGSPFYSPFFIKSPDAHRSYWFLHLSKHREARNEIGMIHWAENNISVHHGGAGLNALGFTPNRGVDQLTLPYLFDAKAKERSALELRDQLPQMILEASQSDIAPSLEQLFVSKSNDTPVVRDMMSGALLDLRNDRELTIVDEHGRVKPRAKTIEWSDRIVLSAQRSFFDLLINR
ncbi:MAG TPA: three-Cys-motif partner protein TcmP [Dongiaceae bacterium]|nr:three-Cys-motif partner protein TcmP [Dongiaceae bacterium]